MLSKASSPNGVDLARHYRNALGTARKHDGGLTTPECEVFGYRLASARLTVAAKLDKVAEDQPLNKSIVPDRQSYLEWQQAEHEAERANLAYTIALRDGNSTRDEAERLLRLREVAAAKLKAILLDVKSRTA